MAMILTKERKMWRDVCLFTIAIFVNTVQGDIECTGEQISTGNQLILNFTQSAVDSLESRPLDSTVWFKPLSTASKYDITLSFGKMDSSGSVQPEYEMLLKMAKNKKLQYYFRKTGGTKLMDGRILPQWLNSQNWTRFSLSDSKFGFHFGNEGQTLDMQMDGVKIDLMDAVVVSGNIDLTASTTCVKFEEITTTTETTPTVISSSPTTIPTTTETPITTSDTPTTIDDSETTTPEGEDDYTVVSEETEANDTNWTDITPVPVREDMNGQDCTGLPVWVWACVGIMIVFFILFIILLTYVIILRRRNRALMASASNLGDGVLSSGMVSTGGYGQQVRDLQFFKAEGKEDSVMIIAPPPSSASYSQTMKLPEGNHMVSDVRFSTAPRSSDYRRSSSCPGPRDSSPSISFPAPPGTPPPETRPETVPLFTPGGSSDNRRRTNSKGRYSNRSSTSRRKKHSRREGIDADDESSLSN